ncbi:MAG: transposase [Tetragenococcus halophilus]|nr:transposase [Tetragenococcus halophilus]
MRKNKRYSANELVDFINLYLINGISYKDLNENYGLNLNSAKFNFYVRKYKENGPTALISKVSNNQYSNNFKEEIAKEYLSTAISYRELAIKYDVPADTTVRDWVLKYTNGKENQSYSPKAEVYSMKTRKTTLEERIKIVEDYMNNHLTYKEAAKKHQINYNNIYSWVAKYKKHGPAGLKDGRGSGKDPEIQTDTEKLKTENEALQAKNKWLEMELEVLKKADQIERELMSQELDNWPPTKR